jgi:hypothetical protein
LVKVVIHHGGSLVKTFRIPETIQDEEGVEREIRNFVTGWVGLLADQRYSEALEPLSPEVPRGSGSVDSRKSPHWTPQLLETVIANYGTPNPVEGQSRPYAVVPLDIWLRDAFEANLSVDYNREVIATLDNGMDSPPEPKPTSGWASRLLYIIRENPSAKTRNVWVGSAEFALPLNLERGNDLSDLSVRMVFKPITKREMVLVLLDIHVL